MSFSPAQRAQARIIVKREAIDQIADVARMPPTACARVLRSHLTKSIREPFELRFRGELDDALERVSLLEVAIVLGAAAPLPSLGVALRRAMARSSMFEYAFELYPQPLVELHTLRYLPGASPACLPVRLQDGGLFPSVLMLDQRLREGNIASFSNWIDGYWGDEVPDIERALSAVSNPSRIAKILRTLDDEDEEDSLWDGRCLLSFVLWAGDLAAIIDRVSDPVAKSVVWHHFGYWFRTLGPQMAGVLSVSLRAAMTSAHRSKSLPLDLESQIAPSVGAMLRLTGCIYGARIEEHFRDHDIHSRVERSLRVRNRPAS